MNALYEEFKGRGFVLLLGRREWAGQAGRRLITELVRR
jgi:hypothetical protein